MKIIRVLLLFIILLALAGGAFALWLRRELGAPVQHAHADEYVEIPRGASTDEILARLQQAGVIRRAWPLRLYVKVTGAAPRLKAGEYRFASPVSPFTVLRKLEEGQQRLARFTIIEGWTRWDIANAMARLPELHLADANEALALMDETSAINDLDPAARNLEGYLYPDTYSFPPNTTPRQMIAAMVQRFRQVWEGEMAEAARAQGKSVREVVTIASLVETEAKLKEERPVIASVIYNRLRRGIPLGIDSTIIYASKL
ncbi:MAG TPA: endolytic transglycosylase MltG, partial [Pyrinomonadaceae bacterium]|nr:endolytic transglycosylase MltG [Pyrinomonadaceae bacterium]